MFICSLFRQYFYLIKQEGDINFPLTLLTAKLQASKFEFFICFRFQDVTEKVLRFFFVFNLVTKLLSFNFIVLINILFIAMADLDPYFFSFSLFKTSLMFRNFCARARKCWEVRNFGNLVFLVSIYSILFHSQTFRQDLQKGFRSSYSL